MTRVMAAGLLLAACLSAQDGQAGVDYDTFRVSRLHCVIGNNKAVVDHRNGYNGVFRMTAPGQNMSVYVPAVAGLNLEHYFDARRASPNQTSSSSLVTPPWGFGG